MGADSAIEWTTHTFNPWVGCARVSPGCQNCYAAVNTFTRAQRAHGRELWGPNAVRHITSEAKWREPLKWNRDAESAGVRARVFCASMADVFEDRPDLVEPRARLFSLIQETPSLDWLLLTKRPENIDRLTTPWIMENIEGPLTNVWLGTTAEDQERADERIPQLLAVPAAVRFLSVEPLLGPVDFRIPFARFAKPGCTMHGADGLTVNTLRGVGGGEPIPGIDWVIVGGESGPGARPCDVAWIRSIVRQCREASVPVFVKQMGAGRRLHTADGHGHHFYDDGYLTHVGQDPKGGDPSEWPLDLRVRQFPAGAAS